jgi:hypothetical protein
MSVLVPPSAILTAVLEGAPHGLTGSLGFQITDPAGLVLVPRRVTGIDEDPPGTYTTSEIAPATAGHYVLRWDYSGTVATEDLYVTVGYASVVDVRAYAPELNDQTDDAILAEIPKAERDIDWYAGYAGAIDETTGLRFVPLSSLPLRQAKAITRSTCAQVQYRLYMGQSFTVDEMQYSEVQGQDQTVTGAQRVGPQARSEFPAGLRKLTGRFA